MSFINSKFGICNAYIEIRITSPHKRTKLHFYKNCVILEMCSFEKIFLIFQIRIEIINETGN